MGMFSFGGNTGETQQSLARKRAIAEAMMANATRPVDMWSGIANAGDKIAGALIERGVNKQDKALQDTRTQTVAQALAAMRGTPAWTNPDNPSEGIAAVPGNKAQAYSMLANSNDPQLAEMAMKLQLGDMQSADADKTWQQHFDVQNQAQNERLRQQQAFQAQQTAAADERRMQAERSLAAYKARLPTREATPASVAEYKYAAGNGFGGTYADWVMGKKSGTSLTVDPNTGTVTFQQGAGVTGKPMTESQSKDTVYVTRAAGALPVLDELGDNLTDFSQSAGGSVPVVGNYLKSPKYQQAQQAGLEFLQAVLRKDTGAAITKDETEEYGKVYLPQPGDSPQVLDQKKSSRQRALDAIQAGMTPDSILKAEQAAQRTARGNPISQGASSRGASVPPIGQEQIINGIKVKRVE